MIYFIYEDRSYDRKPPRILGAFATLTQAKEALSRLAPTEIDLSELHVVPLERIGETDWMVAETLSTSGYVILHLMPKPKEE